MKKIILILLLIILVVWAWDNLLHPIQSLEASQNFATNHVGLHRLLSEGLHTTGILIGTVFVIFMLVAYLRRVVSK